MLVCVLITEERRKYCGQAKKSCISASNGLCVRVCVFLRQFLACLCVNEIVCPRQFLACLYFNEMELAGWLDLDAI